MKTNRFLSAWQNLSENKGTINKCLVDFKTTISMAKDDTFVMWCKKQLSGYSSNKELNSAYYDKIKEFGKIGDTRITKRGDKEYHSVIKCSEYTIFRYFWAKYNGK